MINDLIEIISQYCGVNDSSRLRNNNRKRMEYEKEN